MKSQRSRVGAAKRRAALIQPGQLVPQVSLLLLHGVEPSEAAFIAVDLLLQVCDPVGEMGRL